MYTVASRDKHTPLTPAAMYPLECQAKQMVLASDSCPLWLKIQMAVLKLEVNKRWKTFRL